MFTPVAVESRQKMALIWAKRRERLIAVRVSYDVANVRGCTVYLINEIQELGL